MKLNIIKVTNEDIKKLANEQYAEGGPLHYLKELRGLGLEPEEEDE